MKERSVLNFHPWIFSGAIETNVKSFREGEIVEVFDSTGKYLATGHFHHGTIMVRIISFTRRTIDNTFWIEKLNDAWKMRHQLGLAGSDHTNVFRLVHGEGDGLPGLVIDIYNDTAVIQCHDAGMLLSLSSIADGLQQIEGFRPEVIYNKSAETAYRDANIARTDSWLKGNAVSGIVKENNHLFEVDWVNGQKTGFFIDQRDNRKLLSEYANGKRVLNTFSYSGGFSIYALKAGAAFVDSVDNSKKAEDWTAKNVGLNFENNAPHAFHTSDVFDYLRAEAGTFDIIVLDPPAFAKHLSAVKNAVVGYRNLNQEAIKRIKPGGLIFTFSCSQAIDRQLFRKTVFTAAAKTGRKVQVLHQLSQGADHPVSLYHPEGDYLKGLVLRIT